MRALAFAAALFISVATTAKTIADARIFAEQLITVSLPEVISKKNDTERLAALKKLFHENLDFDTISNFILGPHARRASADDLAAFRISFENFITVAQANNFDGIGGVNIRIDSIRPAQREGEFFLTSRSIFDDPRARPVEIVWRLRYTPAGFKVADVVIEGMSLAASLRSEYSNIMQAADARGENPVRSLSAQLETRAAELRARQ
ncbi:MAG: ABC transporter substrate-binding protein [Alphaproteobacteria bacterium]|nr:ABC transporter substrate-binding protein [Alphaproteobacteria bacterium]